MYLPFLFFSIQMYNYTILFFRFSLPTSTQNYVNASIPKEKTGALSFFESFILMQRLTVLSVIIHETTAHVMSSFDPLHALGLLVCITALSERYTL